MRADLSILFSLIMFLFYCETYGTNFTIYKENGVSFLKKDGTDFFIKGIGGISRMDLAASMGANAFRTWDADVELTMKQLEEGKKYGMYMMMGIWLSHDINDYSNNDYKNAQRTRIRKLVEAFRDHPNMMIWCLGNELNLEGADVKETWEFVNELAVMIKELDTNHPVATVISHSENAVNNIAKYAPSVDVIGFNTYGAIYAMKELFNNSIYEGPYIVTEWGPNGHWENGNTLWGAPIEPSSEEKRIEYEKRYTLFIDNNDRCLGSFVFLWGQKQERTPTWYSLFVEKGVDGLPLQGELCPPVESMEKVWSGNEPLKKAPVVEYVTIAGLSDQGAIMTSENRDVKASVYVSESNGDELMYVWELLKEATELGIGGSYEPRPERIGIVLTGLSMEQEIQLPAEPGNYRLYAYVLNDKGRVGTANIPFQIKNLLSNENNNGKMSFNDE